MFGEWAKSDGGNTPTGDRITGPMSDTTTSGPVMHIDSLANATTGMGTSRDPRTTSGYKLTRTLTQAELSAAWRGSGLIRKIVNVPAFDMVREWREWKADDDDVRLLETEETRLDLRRKVKLAEVLRGRGGGALILGLPGDPKEPVPKTISMGELAYVNVVSRWQLSFERLNDDPTSEFFGQPLFWRLPQRTGRSVDIHPSRVITFPGDTSGALADMQVLTSSDDAYWGECTVSQVLQAVEDNDTARSAFATMLQKASRLRIGIPNLMDLVSTSTGSAMVKSRIAALVAAESIHNATLFDAGGGPNSSNPGETLTDAVYAFAGARDMLNCYSDFVSAVSDIPATRLLGRAPEGLNSSGGSQQDDWNKMVKARQELELQPTMAPFDAILIQSALGRNPEAGEVWFEWSPLDTPSQKEVSERFKTDMEAITQLQMSGSIPEPAFTKSVQSKMIEEGYLPGLEAALREMPDDQRYGISQEGQQGPDQPPPEEQFNQAQLDAITDGRPRTLYIHRQLLNTTDLVGWAEAQGVSITVPLDALHVTVIHSAQALDWFDVDGIWGDAEIVIPVGGPRAMEIFGPPGRASNPLVLQFSSSQLAWRHEELKQAGASSSYPEFRPHVTIDYEAPEGTDPDKIEPYRGELRFGPEIWAEVES